MRDTIRYEKGDDGIVILTLDDPEQSANTMNAAYAESMAKTVDRLEAEKDDIRGVVITSAKSTFFAGGDLNDLIKATKDDAEEIAGFVRDGKAKLRRLEMLGFPEVQLGLLPGAGGVVRSVRMLGIVNALMQVLLQGQRLRPAKAKEL